MHANISKFFKAMGSRLKVHRHDPDVRPWARVSDFQIDIASDNHGEYFDLLVADPEVKFSVLDLRAADRHLLLLATVPSQAPGRPHRLTRLLCGHDERHWFVSGVQTGSTVQAAKEALKPDGVRESQRRHRVKNKDRNKRKNAGFLRQGEWFFVPAPKIRPDSWVILHKEPLQRGRGKPHVVEFLYRCGGTPVYVSYQYPNGVTVRQYTKLIHKNPDAKKLPWQTMVRDPRVYAKGKVRHPDHKTILLPFWHRVLVNDEVLSQKVAFLD